MLKALKASNWKPKKCSPKRRKPFISDRSTSWNPGPRIEPFFDVPKVFCAGAPKAHTPLSTPAVVQGCAEGSSHNQLLNERCRICSARYQWPRSWPKVLVLLLTLEVSVPGKP